MKATSLTTFYTVCCVVPGLTIVTGAPQLSLVDANGTEAVRKGVYHIGQCSPVSSKPPSPLRRE